MNQIIVELAKQAGYREDSFGVGHWEMLQFHNFIDLFKLAIIEELKKEIVSDELIDEEVDIEDRCYLRGNNGGIVDAIVIVQNFGKENDL